jgi:hypothetical protein
MFEIIMSTFGSNLPNAIALSVSAGLLKNLLGFIEKCARDGKYTAFELTQTVKEIAKYTMAVLLLGAALPLEVAVGIAFGIDLAGGKIKRVMKAVPTKK